MLARNVVPMRVAPCTSYLPCTTFELVMRNALAAAALLSAIAATGLAAQESVPSVPLCATPSGGLGVGATCDTLTSPLPVAIVFRSAGDTIPLGRADIEAVFLTALARAVRRPVRADSAWAFMQRGATHVWAEVEVSSRRALKATMLYWVGQPDHTLDLLCQAEATPEIPLASTPALAAVLAAEVRDFGGCAAAQGEQGDQVAVEPAGRRERLLVFIVGPLAAALVASLLLWWFVLRRRPPDFWQLAARYPDKAYQWFSDHDDWVVLDPDAGKLSVPDGREFDGPYLFWVPKLGGRRVAVYGRRSAMQESQRAFLAVHGLDSEGIDRS